MLTRKATLKIFTIPALTYVMFGAVYPIYHLIELCIYEVTLKGGVPTSTYVGLGNFIRVFGDHLFHDSLQVTALFTTLSVLIELLLGIFLAVIIARQRLLQQRLLTTVLILDMMISPVGVALIWRFILYPNMGLVDLFTRNFLRIPISWLGDLFWAKISIILVDVWHWTGFVFLVVYSGYISLPVEVFEAAQVDGASGFQQFFRITLPMLKPTIAVAAFFRGVDVLQAFPELWQLTWGGPSHATTILNILIYIATFDMYDWSYAAVVSLVLMLLALTITLIYLLLIGRLRT